MCAAAAPVAAASGGGGCPETSLHERPVHMHSRKPSRLRRSAPFALAMVMSAFFPGPALGRAGVSVPYNPSDILIAELNAKPVRAGRGATPLAPGPPAGLAGEFGVNSA